MDQRLLDGDGSRVSRPRARREWCPGGIFGLRSVVATVMLTMVASLLSLYTASRGIDEHRNCTECKIIGSRESTVAQATLPFVAVFALLLAWYMESNRRGWKQWLADNAKQGLSAATTHGVGTAIAVVLRKLVADVDECDWYLLLFLMDTILGVTLTIWMHRLTAAWAARYAATAVLSRIGDYEAPPNARGERAPSTDTQHALRWLWQALHWGLVSVLARVVVFFVLWAGHRPFGEMATKLGYWACTPHRVSLKLWLVVVIVPIFIDALQFIVQNFALKGDVLVEAKQVAKQEDIYAPTDDDANVDMVYDRAAAPAAAYTSYNSGATMRSTRSSGGGGGGGGGGFQDFRTDN